jgi:hypothetical protein
MSSLPAALRLPRLRLGLVTDSMLWIGAVSTAVLAVIAEPLSIAQSAASPTGRPATSVQPLSCKKLPDVPGKSVAADPEHQPWFGGSRARQANRLGASVRIWDSRSNSNTPSTDAIPGVPGLKPALASLRHAIVA